MDVIKTEAVNRAALKGWAITRIPPANAPQAWFNRRNRVNFINVSDVVLQEDLVTCTRCYADTDWLSALKM